MADKTTIKKRVRKPKNVTTESNVEEPITLPPEETVISTHDIAPIINENNIVRNDADDVDDDDNNDDGSMKTRRRGRKPKDKFKYESTDLDEYSRNNKKDENVIIKLPLSCLKLNEEFAIGKDLFPYNPNITTPKPYEPGGSINFSLLDENADTNDKDINTNNAMSINNNSVSGIPNGDNLTSTICSKCSSCECNKQANLLIQNNNNNSNNGIANMGCAPNDKKLSSGGKEETRQIDIILNNKYYTNTDKFNVLTHLGNLMNGDKWPEKTDVPCLWDCHTFKNTPWGVPYKFTNGKFQLFGNFCSANCVLAYILQNYQDDDAMWDKVALLNLFYFKVTGEYKSIVPAFDKMGLKLFGGTLDIEEYRNITGANDKAYGVEFPPCNTIIPMLEEIYKKTNLNNTFIPVDKTRLQTANNELKLKRSKPVVNHKNTLDFCLGNV